MKTKNRFLLAGSIAATILLAGAATANTTGKVVEQVQTSSLRTLPVKTNDDTKIGAFANLESFDNDGFNGGVKAAATAYNNGDWASVNSQTSSYSDNGQIYVDEINNQFSTSNIIISAGFQVANAITGMPGQFDGVFTDRNGENTALANSSDKAFVLLDDTVLGNTYSNAASVSYAAEGAGFLAGLAGAVYTEYDANVNNKENANIVMWGGMPFDTVASFLAGFAQAITWTNENYSNVANFKPITIWSGGQKAGEGIGASNSYGSSTDSNTWYTFGFDADTSNSNGKSAELKTQNAIDAGASIVFPVAGGNTTVAEDTLVGNAGTTTKLIGVDADVTVTSAHDDLYIGTAAKNLSDGGQLALWSMDDDDKDGIRNFEDADAAKPSEYSEWDNSNSGKGVELQGSIDNGGVSFIYDEGQQAGINTEFQSAMTAVFGKGTPAEGKEAFEAFLTTATDAQGGVINSSDDAFIPSDVNTESNSNLLWIILGVILSLTIIGGIALLVLKALKKEE